MRLGAGIYHPITDGKLFEKPFLGVWADGSSAFRLGKCERLKNYHIR